MRCDGCTVLGCIGVYVIRGCRGGLLVRDPCMGWLL